MRKAKKKKVLISKWGAPPVQLTSNKRKGLHFHIAPLPLRMGLHNTVEPHYKEVGYNKTLL